MSITSASPAWTHGMDHGSEKGPKIRRLGKFLIFLGDAKRPTLNRCCLLCFQGFQVVFWTGNSLKLAAKVPWKIDGWKRICFFWSKRPIFRKLLQSVSGSVFHIVKMVACNSPLKDMLVILGIQELNLGGFQKDLIPWVQLQANSHLWRFFFKV